ncbi:MAG: aminotransferase class V-fold PLP-dependent enzyme [Chloroflexota bacterium]
MRELFLLDPDVTFLNHGSFGATPRAVFEDYQQWQRRLEDQPVKFLGREIGDLLANARQTLGSYVNVDRDDLVYVPNATFGVNVVARSLPLGPGDEVLATDHEYGACENIWRYLSQQRGFGYVRQPISLPITTAEAIVEQLWAGVTSRTKVIFLSHITSPTAVRLPVEAICARAREAGIMTVVDGTHAPGQLPLDLTAMGVDFYTGNAHKWLCAPKGAAFLYVRSERQDLIEPLIIGWGWGADRQATFGSDFLDYIQYPGTNDYASYLSVPAAIQFQEEHDWGAVRAQCRDLAGQFVLRMHDLTGLDSVYPSGGGNFFCQMALAPLPEGTDVAELKTRLYDDYRIEIPTIRWNDHPLIRISVQGYNTQADVDALLDALEGLL